MRQHTGYARVAVEFAHDTALEPRGDPERGGRRGCRPGGRDARYHSRRRWDALRDLRPLPPSRKWRSAFRQRPPPTTHAQHPGHSRSFVPDRQPGGHSERVDRVQPRRHRRPGYPGRTRQRRLRATPRRARRKEQDGRHLHRPRFPLPHRPAAPHPHARLRPTPVPGGVPGGPLPPHPAYPPGNGVQSSRWSTPKRSTTCSR